MGTVCSGDSRNPLPRDTEAMPAPLILDAFAHTSPLLMPLTRVPARGELITLVVCLALGEQRKEVVSASRPPWSCALSSGSAVPKERGKHRRVGKTQQLCQQAYCPCFGWDRVNFLFSSWYSAVFWI